MFSRTGDAALKLNLDNTWALCRYLDMPQEKFPSVHIAGTNGKGSVSHLLASVFQEAGYTTGLYTSPHLKDFRERIKVNGKMIQPEQVVHIVKRLQPIIEEIEPSFFEVTVAMAFHQFAEEEVDIAIIETGLGGRLDSTNVITPILSIITNIGLDHVSILGNTHESIAREKAGIIKPGIPVIIGSTQETTRPVFLATAQHNESSILFADQVVSSTITERLPDRITVALLGSNEEQSQVFQTPLSGAYQQENICTVVAACKQLVRDGWKLTDTAMKKGMLHVIKNTGLHGRWEVIEKNPLIVLDVAHNKEAMEKVVAQINEFSFKHVYLIMGTSADKDVDGILKLLPKSFTYGFTEAAIPRAMKKEQLLQKATAAGHTGKVFENVNKALDEFKRLAEPDDLIIVCGSIFVVGEVDRT